MKCKIRQDVTKRLQFSTSRYLFSKDKASGLEKLLHNQDFVESAVVNPVTGNITVNYQEGARLDVLTWMADLKFSQIEECTPEEGNSDYWLRRNFHDAIIKRLAIRFVMKNFMPLPFAYLNFAINGLPYIKEGLKSLFGKKALDVHVLDMTAILGALAIRDIGSANSAIFYLGISELLEDYTETKTKLDLGRSLVLQIEKVWKVQEDGSEVQVGMDQLKLGDTISIYEGTMIPVDGKVVSGIASVDEATMTGESEPAAKQEGSSVYAGTVVAEGNIKVKVRALENETRLSKIVDLIYDGTEQKAKSVAKAERLADRIVPYSLGLALLTGLLTRSLTKGVAVLMVDYSCALRLTIPLGVLTAVREGVDNSVLIRGGKYLEAFNQAKSIVFDKTGTLTKACPQVEKVIAMQGFSEEKILRDVACIEEHFPHSMAKAIVQHAAERGISHEELHNEVRYVVAHGIVTELNGHRALVGSRHFIFEDEGVEFTEELAQSLKDNQSTSSVIFFALDEKPAGYVLLKDPPRDNAKDTIKTLRERGIENIWMLTGDDEKNAASIAAELGISQYKAQVLPEDKADIVAQIRAKHGGVIMVGDGINDSPALAKATVSVAMRDASDLAKKVADIVIMDSDLEKLVFIRDLSHAAMKRIDRSYWRIIGFNSLLIGLGIFGATTATTNSLLHNLSTFVFGAWNTKRYFNLSEKDRQLSMMKEEDQLPQPAI